MSTASTPHRVGTGEITELLAWCRRLTVAGPDADPAQRAAHPTAKTELLTPVTDPGPRPTGPDHDREEQR